MYIGICVSAWGPRGKGGGMYVWSKLDIVDGLGCKVCLWAAGENWVQLSCGCGNFKAFFNWVMGLIGLLTSVAWPPMWGRWDPKNLRAVLLSYVQAFNQGFCSWRGSKLRIGEGVEFGGYFIDKSICGFLSIYSNASKFMWLCRLFQCCLLCSKAE